MVLAGFLDYDGSAGYGAGIGSVWTGHGFHGSVPVKDFGQEGGFGGQGFVPLDGFTGVGSHASEDGGHGAFGAVFGFVEGLVVADGVEEVVVFLLVGVFALAVEAPGGGVVAMDGVAVNLGGSFTAVGVFGDAVPATSLVAALAEHFGSVGVFEFDAVVVKDFTGVGTDADFGAAHAVGFDGVAAFEPVDDVEVVDVLFDDVVAANPVEVVPVAHLVFHFREFASVLFF